MNLTEHFTLEELTHSDLGVRKGIDNTPTPDIITSLHALAKQLEKVRALIGVPLIISSGYRSLALNILAGGAEHSAHVRGEAADFIAPMFGTPGQIALAIQGDASISFDQLIYEGTWVHLGVDSRQRRQVLTASFIQGKATYREGITA